MSYTPTQWSAGDTVTSAKLNKMEQGITDSNKILIINLTQEDGEACIMDKTWRQIYDADYAICRFSGGENGIYGTKYYSINSITASPDSDSYTVELTPNSDFDFFDAPSENDYPVYGSGR